MAVSNLVKRIQDIMRNDAGVDGDAQRISQMTWMFFLKVYDAKEEEWEFYNDKYVSLIPDKLKWRNWAIDDKSNNVMTGDKLLDFVNNTLFPYLKGNEIELDGQKLRFEISQDTPLKQRIVRYVFEDAQNYMKDGVLLRQVINDINEVDFSEYKERHEFGTIYETILKSLQSAGNAGEFYTPRAVTDFMVQMIAPKLGESVADFACGTGGFLTSALKYLEPQKVSPEDIDKYNNTIYGIEKKPLPYLLCITNMLLHDVDEPKIYHSNSLEKNVRDYSEKDKFDIILMNPPYGGSEKDAVKNNFPATLRSSETADLFMNVIMYRLKKNGRCAVIIPDGFLFGTDNAKFAIKEKLFSEFNLHTIIRMPHDVFAPYTSITTNILFFDNTTPTKETWVYRMDMPEEYKHFSKTRPILLDHFEPVAKWWNDREELTVDDFPKAKRYSIEDIKTLGYNIDLCGFPHEEEEILPPQDLIKQYREKRASLDANIDRVLAEIMALLGEEMKAEQLRKSILQMAIQGKLVPQNPNDEPASVLLEKICAEKQRLIKEGKIKKDKVDSVIFKGDDNRYYEKIGNEVKVLQELDDIILPESWEICRFSSIANIFTGNSINEQEKAKKYAGLANGYNYIGTKDVAFDKTINYNNGVKIPFDTSFKIAHKRTPLLCIEGGSAGKKIGILSENVCFGNKLCAFESYGVNPTYIYYFLQSPAFIDIFKSNTTGIIGGVSVNVIKSLFFFLPPLPEQERIVAEIEKYEPILTEYDKFEQQKSQLDGEIYDKLKKSILQYAIQGKLVPQDKNDEPASELLKRIRTEKKAQLGKKYVENFIYKGDDNCYYEKVGTEVKYITEEIPFDIPENWAWARINTFIDFSKNETTKAIDISANSWILDLEDIEKDSGKILCKKRFGQIIAKSDKHKFKMENVLYSKLRPYLNKVVVADEDGYCTTEILVFDFGTNLLNRYAQIFLMSPYFVNYAMSGAYGVKMPRIGSERGNNSLIPVPPYNEQIRIVKVANKLKKIIDKGEN